MVFSIFTTGDLSSIPRSGRSPGGGHGNPLQYSCLKNPKFRGAWQATVYSVAKSLSSPPLHSQVLIQLTQSSSRGAGMQLCVKLRNLHWGQHGAWLLFSELPVHE